MKTKLLLWSPIALPIIILLVFVVLKIIGVISWSWWWITAPIWMPIALIILITVVALSMLKVWQKNHPEEYRKFMDND